MLTYRWKVKKRALNLNVNALFLVNGVVAETENFGRILINNLIVVRSHKYGGVMLAVNADKQFYYIVRSLRVKVARRFIGNNKWWVIKQ